MNRYNQVIVVEGVHDKQKIESIFPNVECIVTNGSSISNSTLNLIYQASLVKEVILFLDPDFPGKKITNQILDTKGKYKIAYISKDKSISKNGKKVGVEHAKKEDIIESLSKLFTVSENKDNIKTKDLMKRKLINYNNSKAKRILLCESLNIPLLNGKALLKYLNILNIDLERIDEIIERA